MLPGFPCSVPRSTPALTTAASSAANKHVFRTWQSRARMHTDHQGPASQDEERDSFLANIGRIKLHQDSYPDSPMSLSSRVHGAISQAQEGLGKILLLLLSYLLNSTWCAVLPVCLSFGYCAHRDCGCLYKPCCCCQENLGTPRVVQLH
jgi:hypothetical protein